MKGLSGRREGTYTTDLGGGWRQVRGRCDWGILLNDLITVFRTADEERRTSGMDLKESKKGNNEDGRTDGEGGGFRALSQVVGCGSLKWDAKKSSFKIVYETKYEGWHK